MPPLAAVAVLRPFGSAADLDLDFATGDRPALVTDLLTRCASPQDASYWWARCVGQRIAMLLRLLEATTGCPCMALSSSCLQPGCGAAFEFELETARLLEREFDDGLVEIPLDAGRQVALRRPTGEDLRAWRCDIDPARPDAMQRMLETLCVRGLPGHADMQRIAQVMGEFDPLVDLSVACSCPECGTAQEVAVDLEGLALARLRAVQEGLLRDVHDFARHYGWTEAETLAVPRERRAIYRALIKASA